MATLVEVLPKDVMNIYNSWGSTSFNGEATVSSIRLTGAALFVLGGWYAISIIFSGGTVAGFARSTICCAAGHDLYKLAMKISEYRKDWAMRTIGLPANKSVLDMIKSKISNLNQGNKEVKNKEIAKDLAQEAWFKTFLVAIHALWVKMALNLIAKE